MRLQALVTLLLFITICAHAQKQTFEKGKWGVKLYQNTDIFSLEHYSTFPTRESTKSTEVNFHRFSVAVIIGSKKGLTHEIELLIPEIRKHTNRMQFPMEYSIKNNPSFKSLGSSYSLRYEVSKNVGKEASRLRFGLGAGINPYYILLESKPTMPNAFDMITKTYGFSLNVIPKIKYQLSTRLAMDLGIPIKLYDLRRGEVIIENPNIPYHQRSTTQTDNLFFEQAYTIRLGFLYLFN